MLRLLGFFCALSLLSACREPTQITLELSTDALCADLAETKLWAGVPGEMRYDFEQAAINHRGPTPHCGDDGRIGSIVAVPSGDDEAFVGFEVVTRVGNLACEAPPTYGPGCITARRGLRFLPHSSLDLPIHLSLECLGVICEATETCQAGRCIDSQIASCSEAGCDPSPQTFADPETLLLEWQAVTAPRYAALATIGGRLLAAGEGETSGAVVVSAFLAGGEEAWQTTFDGDGAAHRIAVEDGEVRVIGHFAGSLEIGEDVVSEPEGGIFSTRLHIDGEAFDARSFALSFSEGVIGGLRFGGEAVAVSGSFVGALQVDDVQSSGFAETVTGFVGIVGSQTSLQVWPKTVSIDDVVFDAGGDIFIAGRSPGTFTLNGGVSGSGDVFVARLDPQGQTVRWARGFATGSTMHNESLPSRLALGPDGLSLLGSFREAFSSNAGSVEPVLQEIPGSQIFVLTLAPEEGIALAAHRLGSSAGASVGRDLAITPGGGIAVAAEIPPGKEALADDAVVASASGLVLIRFDRDGEHLALPIGEGQASAIAPLGVLAAVAAGAEGNLYAAGIGSGLRFGEKILAEEGFVIAFSAP